MTVETSRRGAFGTLYLYVVRYKDAHDSGCPEFMMNVWAYSAEHAEQKFSDSDDDGWMVLSITRKASR